MNLSIVIPAYNEETRIGSTLQKLLYYCRKHDYDYEIIVVNDGSTDKTSEIVRVINNPNIKLINLERNKGKGYAVKTGVMAAKKDFILMTDADLSTPIEELEKFQPRSEKTILIGSRGLRKSDIIQHQPKFRELGGKILNKVIQISVLPGIKDSQCGFKLFSRNNAHDIFQKQTIPRFGFDVEVLFVARKSGYTIQEIPIRWENHKATKVRPFRDGITILGDLLRIRLNHIRGLY
jgi:dolichyl-phosphate beta-glucosyltransferase